MTLVDDHIIPFDLAEDWSIFDDVLVCREQHLPVTKSYLILLCFTSTWGTLVDDLSNRWRPFLELKRPVGEGTI